MDLCKWFRRQRERPTEGANDAASPAVTDVTPIPAPPPPPALPDEPPPPTLEPATEPAPAVEPAAPEPADPLDNKPWCRLVEECVELFDELDRYGRDFDPARREVAEHVNLRLQEILERAGVAVIASDAPFERACHQPEPSAAPRDPTATVAHILSPGFRVGRRVLRRARVTLVSPSDASGEPS